MPKASSSNTFKLHKPLIIFYILVFYIFASFIWWSYLLIENTRHTYEYTKKIQLLELEHEGVSSEDVLQTDVFDELDTRYNRQIWMIIGEGIVFLILLTLAVWRIRQSFRQEISLARQQRNFLLSITHELKSPLASIKLALETMIKRDLDKERARRLLDNSLSDTNRLQNLVEDILFAAKFEDHHFEFAQDNINISNLSSGVIDKIVEQNEDRRNFSVQIEPDICVLGERQALGSLVSNLVENAVKYSSNGEGIDIHLFRKDGQAVFTVSDHGIGIPDEEKSNIFKKFYRIGNEDTRKAKGTGLGLFIVKEVVHGLKGEIKVEDNQPKGVKFTVSLPAVENN